MSASNWFRDTCAMKVADIVKDKQPILSVDSRTSIAATLDLLNEQNVTTLAVYGEVGHWLGDSQLVCGNKQYIGMVTILDILSHLMQHPEPLDAHLQEHISNAIGSTPETLSIWTEAVDRPLFFCMEQFCRGTHHAFCVSSASDEPRMLSQSDLVAFLLSNESAMPHISASLDRPIGSIASAAVDVAQVGDLLANVLRKLIQHHALPVVDDSGNVLSTLSASDMKGQLGAMVALMAPMTVMDYILYRNADDIPAPFVLDASTTVREAARAMVQRGMHRVWIQPPALGKAPGVMSLTDVIRMAFTAELLY